MLVGKKRVVCTHTSLCGMVEKKRADEDGGKSVDDKKMMEKKWQRTTGYKCQHNNVQI